MAGHRVSNGNNLKAESRATDQALVGLAPAAAKWAA